MQSYGLLCLDQHIFNYSIENIFVSNFLSANIFHHWVTECIFNVKWKTGRYDELSPQRIT